MSIKLAIATFTSISLVRVEALLSAVVADNMIGDRHQSNRELIAQGAASILSPLVGGMPATAVSLLAQVSPYQVAQRPERPAFHTR
ncbi:MAG: SulP family inorganic anion transporter [Thiobacillus sp.]|nr:SulP family inorganic anion transporter [Thiobacillus sp.]